MQGDITGFVDTSGNQMVTYTYDAWGNVIDVSGLYTYMGYLNGLRYRGYYYDNETNSYYLQSRYYNPQLCRFINADDGRFIGASGTLLSKNAFAYCENNPIYYIDSSGTVITPANIIGAAIGAIIGVVGGVFLGNWLADTLKLSGWKRKVFVGGVAALVGATAGAIGYFIGPYVAKIAVKLGRYVAKLIQKGKLAIKKMSSKVKSSVRSLFEKTCCFVSGTQVSTPYGDKFIEEIAVGDYVYSANTETGEIGTKKVLNIFINKTYVLYHVITSEEEIIATEEHPFWVDKKGWIAACNLVTGDILCSQNGKKIEIIKVFVEYLQNPIEVYNFEVEDWHTYFVGEDNILVHNKCSLTKINDKYLSKKKIDPHALKRDYLGKKADISLFDLYKDKETGVVFILRKGAEETLRIATHIVL